MGGHIFEIIVMLLIAAILGFLIAWFWRKDKINELEAYITSLEDRNNRLQADFKDNERTLMDCQAEKKKLEVDKQSLEKLLIDCQGKLLVSDVKLVKNEIDNKKNKKKVKEGDKVTKAISKQDAAIERVKEKSERIDFGRIGTSKEDEKDDLKIIKGVGPFIEKKLNALGIFTFKQIANFTDEDKDIVNDAIEFFKGRIKRDDWVGQAKDFIK